MCKSDHFVILQRRHDRLLFFFRALRRFAFIRLRFVISLADFQSEFPLHLLYV